MATPLPTDPLWPRAGHWIVPVGPDDDTACDLALLGVPAREHSITPTGADSTPAAVPRWRPRSPAR